MIESYAQSLGHFLQANPHWGGIITFFIAFLESLVIFGTIIPGSVTMTAVGMLVGTAILPLSTTLLWASLGAFIGDLLGYWLGIHYNERLRNLWPFKKQQGWLETGENFFHRHGGKSILIGRFIGPFRSVIPMIAGCLHMPWQKFVLAALPTAALWAFVYMLPGIALGALSLQLPANIATKFILTLLSILVAIAIFAWLIKYFFSKYLQYYRRFIGNLWQQLRCHRSTKWLTELIGIKNEPDNGTPLTWLLVSAILLILFLILFWGVVIQNHITAFNRPTFELLRSLRQAAGDRLFVAITLLGDGYVLCISGGLIFLALLVFKKVREAGYWLVSLGMGLIIPNLFKYILYFPRPYGLLHPLNTSSFPSGHTFLSMLYYGTLAMFISTHLEVKYRIYAGYCAFIIIASIAISRIYLGAHWVTDVVASIFLAGAVLALLTIFYRRNYQPWRRIGFFAGYACLLTLTVWAAYLTLFFQKHEIRYSLLWPSKIIETNTWWGGLNPILSIYRENRLGKPIEPMNVQFAGDIQQLKNLLTAQGWVASSNASLTSLKSTLQKLSTKQTNFNTLLPSLYLNNPPVLTLSKESPNNKMVINLWESKVYLAKVYQPLYIGTAVIYEHNQGKGKIKYTFNTTDVLSPYFNKTKWQTDFIKASHFPRALVKQNWNGVILQIVSPTVY